MSEPAAESVPPDNASPAGSRRLGLSAVVLIVLTCLAFGNTLGNSALLRHTPDAYRTPLLANAMLRSRVLLPKVFTGEFLLTTHGEYRPAGYALFGLINGALPRGADGACAQR